MGNRQAKRPTIRRRVVRPGQVWRSKRNGQEIVIGPSAGDARKWHFKTLRGQAHAINENRLFKWYEIVKS